MNKKNDSTKHRPLLQFAHVERKPFRGQIDVRVLDDLDAYAKYVQSQSGHEPSIDEVAEKAIAKVLNSDTGFRQWQRSQKPHWWQQNHRWNQRQTSEKHESKRHREQGNADQSPRRSSAEISPVVR